MQKNPNDGSNDNPDEFSEFREKPVPDNLKATAVPLTGGVAGQDASIPNTAATSPAYGEFGAPHANASNDVPAGGVAAPSVAAPEQRGSAPQNLATDEVKATQQAPGEERREAYKQDDPRYGSGTRNWETSEPANRSTGSEDGASRLDQNA